MAPPPPPPGSAALFAPPPPGASDIPPPGAETHENDVLRRRKHFSWRSFGGDGFLVSVAFHVMLLLIGLFYVIQKYVEPKKPDTEIFATGAGGGAAGDKAKQFEHTMKRKMTAPVKTPTRIVSKSANASVSLPSTPATSAASFASGLASGGMSKGSGGGSGGGEGTGIGIGKGGGRNFVSLFGAIGKDAPGLPGVFYDMKQGPDLKKTKYEAADSIGAYANDVLRVFIRNWSTTSWDRQFFKAPEQLTASQIFIPHQNAGAAPAAFRVQDKVQPSRWAAYYHGTVKVPQSGKFRFWGLGDDALVVRFNRRLALDSGWTILTEKGSPNLNVPSSLGVSESKKGVPGAPFRAGPWITVNKGDELPIDILISEIPGGSFASWLFMEEAVPGTTRGDGKLFLFRMTDEPLPQGLNDDTGLNIDMTGKGLIWKARGAAKGPAR